MTDLFLIAAIDGRGIAIETAQIDAVIDLGEVVAVPRTDAAVRGLAAIRSRVVTVVDTRLLLGLEASPPSARRVMTTIVDGHLYAFLADAFEDIVPLERLPLASGVALGAGWQQAACAMVERDGEPLLVLDLAALVREASALAA